MNNNDDDYDDGEARRERKFTMCISDDIISLIL